MERERAHESRARAIQAGAGQAVAHEPTDAAVQATRSALRDSGLTEAAVAFVFCADPDVENAAKLGAAVSEAAGGATVIGCSAVSVIEGDDELEGDPAVVVLVAGGPGFRVTPLLLEDHHDPTSAADQAARALDPETENALLVALTDPSGFHPALLPSLSRSFPGVPIIGGGAASHNTFVLADGGSASTGTALLLIESPMSPLITVSQGCRPMGPEFRITRSKGNLVLTLDDRPALDVFKEAIGPSLEDQLDETSEVVFAALGCGDQPLENGYVVRGIVGFEPEMGVVAVGDHVHEGQAMAFALKEGMAAREDHDRTVAGLAEQLNGDRPAFGLYFDCAGRGRGLYGYPGIDIAYIRKHLGAFPLAGMFAAFELAPIAGVNQVHMFSGVLAVWTA